MKKINTKLQFTTTTVRVLQSSALALVRGGGGTKPSNDPVGCVKVYNLDGAAKL